MKRQPSEPSQRQLRVGEQIRHIIAETLQRGHFHDEILMDAGRITVTQVRISPDLKHATAYVMSLGGENMDRILPALNEAAPVFQKDIAKQGGLRFTPKVRFSSDDSFDEARRIEEILHDIKQGK
ncbi:MAG: 30S ribosome-binding factor RbfA [Alphaproteobacteria bacterium]|nr:30S ribosome-binding factor RbfA [Alphaproteobacteria bacterium]